MNEPRMWSGITDALPNEHPLAFESIACIECKSVCHAGYNENMTPWVETGRGAYCLSCFMTLCELDDWEVHDDYGLTDEYLNIKIECPAPCSQGKHCAHVPAYAIERDSIIIYLEGLRDCWLHNCCDCHTLFIWS